MLGRSILRAHQVTQRRFASGFNKSPVLKRQMIDGVSGNTVLAFGVVWSVTMLFIAQSSGALIPNTPGIWGIRSARKIKDIDLYAED